MKKYISLIVCAVLLIVAFAIGTPAKTGIIAGAGDGKGSHINTVEQFVDVIDFFENYELTSSGVTAQTEGTGYSATNSQSAYNSATFYNKSRATVNSYTSRDSYSYSSNSNYTREMTIYLTQGAALYHSVGVILSNTSVNSSGESKDVVMTFDFDMHIYFTADSCLVYFAKWNVTSSDADVTSAYNFVKPSMLNKWYDAGVLGEMLLSVNEENYEVLGAIGDYFDEYKTSKFKTSGKVYTLEDDYVYEVFSLMFGTSYPEDVRGGFTLNLSDSFRPTLSMTEAYSMSNFESSYSYEITAYSENNMVFSNINNTVINASQIKLSGNLEDLVEEGVL